MNSLYGKYVTDLLEKRTDAELALFSDPVEAAAFFCLLDLMRRSRGRRVPGRTVARYTRSVHPCAR